MTIQANVYDKLLLCYI